MIDWFVFDLDGTITKAEILPQIAKAIGMEKPMADLTRRTMDGEIPFDLSLKYRTSLLSKIDIQIVKDIVRDVELDSNILDFIQANKNRCCIITGNLDIWVKDLMHHIGVPWVSSQAIVKNGRVHLEKTINKQEAARRFIGKKCSIGDGMNDYSLFIESDISFAYGGVHPPAPDLIKIATHSVYDSSTLCRMLSELS